ncbi:hypothetical protein QF046_001119 [Microbacterium sp. W4I4]|uniref:hypothetical protein n=1 Tax=Microbacterium sp. W4I4 TaxID=3042295 RepID=UPI00277E3F4B|nr:hypothetical protein [Microbacterium sp. W4I4]MDQ0613478.1 hypothetical protein [Microbacterium sp. W4I4]
MSTASASMKRRSETPTAPEPRLLISLPQIAALAKVRRPVVSVWRTRFGSSPNAFPAAVEARAGREYFDAREVADWLVDTSHGNNPDAAADAAAYAMHDVEPAGAERQDAIEALLALRVCDGMPLTGGDLRERARRADPRDQALLTEVLAVADDRELASFVEQTIDAAYSPVGSWSALQSGRATSGAEGTAGALSPVGTELIARLVLSLTDVEDVVLADPGADLSARDLFADAADLAGDHADLHVPPTGRRLRRRLMVHGRAPLLDAEPPQHGRAAVWIARLRGVSPESELAQLDELLVDLSDTQRLVVVGPDSLLTEALSGPAATSREYALRSGRVRGIVRLTAGLVPAAARQSLAVWVVGGPQGGTALADRFTVVGDLRGASLTEARMQDLVSDLAVSLGTVREAMSHAFRFVRFVRTSTLLAGGESLVAASHPQRPRSQASPAELSALVDQKLVELDEPSLTVMLQAPARRHERSVLLADAVAAREARLIGGTRLQADETSAEDGYPVIGRDEVRAGEASARRVDRIRVALDHPRAELTLPGDVIVLTGPTPAALVDPDGSSVVEYPARILRLLNDSLVPAVVAADVNAYAEPIPWRRWSLRRVAAGQKAALQTTLADIIAARRIAERRAAELGALEALVTDAVAAGALIGDQPDMTSEMTEPEGTI